MKEILENIFDKKIEHITFNQWVDVYPKQYTDGEIYETEVNSQEPTYVIKFLDGSTDVLELSELIVKIFNYK
jgi:hypothetical protein